MAVGALYGVGFTTIEPVPRRRLLGTSGTEDFADDFTEDFTDEVRLPLTLLTTDDTDDALLERRRSAVTASG